MVHLKEVGPELGLGSGLYRLSFPARQAGNFCYMIVVIPVTAHLSVNFSSADPKCCVFDPRRLCLFLKCHWPQEVVSGLVVIIKEMGLIK